MTGNFLLDWAALAVSLFNTILQSWLGLTVLLNAERRTWGIWLAGAGMLLGGVFFISHSAILGHGQDLLSPGMNFWWNAGWGPVIALPFVWYVVMLWYNGYWESTSTNFHRRQRPWLVLVLSLSAAMTGLLLFANPLPSFTQLVNLALKPVLSLAGVPLLILAYPVYILLCISLSLDALLQPGPSGRVMGDLARRRARPWLIGTSLGFLVVSLLVGWAMLWIFQSLRFGVFPQRLTVAIGWLDLFISAVIAISVILLGQAVVSYEIFTGKTLPRHGLSRFWHRVMILAAGFSSLAGWSLVVRLRPVYSLLLACLLITAFYALLGWRSYAERERMIASLRPFVASQHLYDRLLSDSPGVAGVQISAKESGLANQGASLEDSAGVTGPFYAICSQVLGTGRAVLAALGPLAPLSGPPLVYPPGAGFPAEQLAEIVAVAQSETHMAISLDPSRNNEMAWAVPLWGERGLVGVLLLGVKRDGSLYTQEEIEVARAVGERLIDLQASSEMARRLMALQRQRLAESQVLDRRARRALHDEVLPRLHSALLTLSSLQSIPAGSDAIACLTDVHRQISDLLRSMPPAVAPELARSGLIEALRRVAEEELAGAFDQVIWQIEPEGETCARSIQPFAAETLYYAAREAIRNAARHGRQAESSQPFKLQVEIACREIFSLCIVDNGIGLALSHSQDPDPLQMRPGGQGLALHSTMMAVIGGSLEIESVPGRYTRVRLSLPLPLLS